MAICFTLYYEQGNISSNLNLKWLVGHGLMVLYNSCHNNHLCRRGYANSFHSNNTNCFREKTAMERLNTIQLAANCEVIYNEQNTSKNMGEK